MTDAPVGALRRRMIENMTSRRLAPRTQEAYMRAVKNFTTFLGCSPDQTSVEDLRRYHLHIAASGTTTPKLNAAVTALRFLFSVTLGRPEVTERLPFVREPRKLPVILRPEEVEHFLEAAPGLKLRVSEIPGQDFGKSRTGVRVGFRERRLTPMSRRHPVFLLRHPVEYTLNPCPISSDQLNGCREIRVMPSLDSP